MKIHLLNHSAVVVETEDVKLLCDPWFFGTCFDGGWGLKYDNPEALTIAQECTHLWISHFHPDHYHLPTLSEIAKINPDIIVLGNHSFNFQLDHSVKRFGFKNIIPLDERKKLEITNTFRVKRFPATGIDNMLVIHTNEGNILNYNDCNLPQSALRSLSKKIGEIDILLSNFNHAGKITDYRLSNNDIMKDMKDRFRNNFQVLNPRWIIPFASHHYYRPKESMLQNSSLMDTEDLVELDKRIIPLHVGETVNFDTSPHPYINKHSRNIKQNEYTIEERQRGYSLEELSTAYQKYAKRLNSGYLGLTFWIPPLNIKVEDLECHIQLDTKRGLTEIGAFSNDIHITAHSEAVYKWFNQPYGANSFWTGAHFGIINEKVSPLKRQFLAGLLHENRLDLKSILKSCISLQGLSFFFNRREEIFYIIIGTKFTVGFRD